MAKRQPKEGAPETSQGAEGQGTKSYSYDAGGRFWVSDSALTDNCDGDQVRVEELPEDPAVLKRIIGELAGSIDAMRAQEDARNMERDVDGVDGPFVCGLGEDVGLSVEAVFAAAAASDNMTVIDRDDDDGDVGIDEGFTDEGFTDEGFTLEADGEIIGMNDDCDGEGVVGTGRDETCSNGTFVSTVPVRCGSEEWCDGVDTDCNATGDEGVCRGGIRTCEDPES